MKWIASEFRVSTNGSLRGKYLCTQLVFNPYTEDKEEWYKKQEINYIVSKKEEEQLSKEYEKKYNVKIKWQPITLTNGLTYRAYVIQE